MRKIAFHSYQLSLRGTEIALFDYAHFNEILLKNKSIILTPKASLGNSTNDKAKKKFENRFKVYYYEDIVEIEKIIEHEEVDIFYSIRAGHFDDLVPKNCHTCIHAVFGYHQPHGDVYAYVSSWLSKRHSDNTLPFVPHMVYLPEQQSTMREKLDIPSNALVFGRYGGIETFDIEFVKQLVYEIADQSKDIYFLFMNTENFLGQGKSYYRKKIKRWLWRLNFPKKSFSNIIFLEGTDDLIEKRKFINTCDAMLHARWEGETFGLAVAEFSICNKPVLSCNHSKVNDRAHLEVLGDLGLFYSSKEELKTLILDFRNRVSSRQNWDAYSKTFSPEKVMEKFNDVFIKPFNKV